MWGNTTKSGSDAIHDAKIYVANSRSGYMSGLQRIISVKICMSDQCKCSSLETCRRQTRVKSCGRLVEEVDASATEDDGVLPNFDI